MRRLKSLAALFLIFFSFTSIGLAAEAEGPTLILHSGEQRLVEWHDLSRYALTGAAIQAKPLPRSLERASDKILIRAIRPGSSDLLLFRKDGLSEHRKIVVLPTSYAAVPPSLANLLSRLSECEIISNESQTLLRGQITSSEEASRIEAALELGRGAVKEEVELAQELVLRQRIEVERWLSTQKTLSRFQTSIEMGRLFIRGSVPTAALKAQVTKALKTKAPLSIIEASSLSDSSPTVYFQIFLVELKKSRAGSLGLNWNTPIVNAFRVSPSKISSALGVDVALQALETEGALKILSNPEIAVRAPGEAELFSGGELPIHLDTKFYSNVNWKSYGLSLKIKVIEANGEAIRLDILTEMSHLDRTTTSGEVPGIQSNRLKTQVDAMFGTPLLLSGLTTEQTREDAKGLPYLRRLPILGSLFGSEDYLNERSELVAILVPKAAPPAAPHRSIERMLPKGPLPIIENRISPLESEKIRQDSMYPWVLFR